MTSISNKLNTYSICDRQSERETERKNFEWYKWKYLQESLLN